MTIKHTKNILVFVLQSTTIPFLKDTFHQLPELLIARKFKVQVVTEKEEAAILERLKTIHQKAGSNSITLLYLMDNPSMSFAEKIHTSNYSSFDLAELAEPIQTSLGEHIPSEIGITAINALGIETLATMLTILPAGSTIMKLKNGK
jgi:hypothetical protein